LFYQHETLTVLNMIVLENLRILAEVLLSRDPPAVSDFLCPFRAQLHPDFSLRQIVRCAKCGKGLPGGIAKKKFPYYWCYKPGCRAVSVPTDKLEHQFVSLLAMHRPTVELLERLPDIARKHWQTREERKRQDSRALNIRLQEQKRLNSTAIKAKLRGELSAEDFDALKASITEETTIIEQQLSALESERPTMEELLEQTKRELVDLVAAWSKSGVNQRRELCTALFPDGLAWSHQSGFLNHQNVGLMQDLRAFMDEMASGVMIGVPDRTALNRWSRVYCAFSG
jgi:hypothetical protein